MYTIYINSTNEHNLYNILCGTEITDELKIALRNIAMLYYNNYFNEPQNNKHSLPYISLTIILVLN